MMKKFKLFICILAVFVSAFGYYTPDAEAAPEPSQTASDTSAPPSESPEASATDAHAGTVNTAANLREQPSAASASLALLPQGETVSAIENAGGGWLKVLAQGQTGYIRADFVDTAVTGLNEPAVIIADTALTEQPGAGNTIANFTYNTQITVIGSYGAYYQVRTDAQSGYVPKSAVHKYRVIDINLKASLNSSNVNVRSLPSTTGDVLDVLKSGTDVTVQSIQDKWVKVSYSGKEGYIRGDFITYTVPAGSHLTTLTQGMKCQAVTQLQIALKKKGFFYPAANGVFGNATREGVAKFQSAVGLESDGIAGPQTLLVLLGKTGAANLWNNYRTEMPAQKTQKSGRVYLEDWFDGMEKDMKKMQPFEVIDVRTGIHWNMERFGGWWHADVETMTKADTEAMTKAWGGELNPTRRPVWVKIGDKYYAASLMGYVHNTDTIGSNGMDGQICLHFRGSKIHGSGRIDEAHQACIQEAFAKSYKLDAYIEAGKV